jgi:nucleotide-binding universal stress UspA family protein
MKILTMYDGTLQSKTALKYGIGKVKEKGGELIVLQVFQRSLFVDYDAGPQAQEIARAEAKQHHRDAVNIIAEAGQDVVTRIMTEDGDPEQELLRVAADERADLVLASPRYKGIVQSAPCPVIIMPGTILLPVDNAGRLLSDLGYIVNEAKATGSKIAILGLVPVHLYGTEEKDELELVRKSTNEEVKKITDALREQGIEVSGTVRSGYPDEEILKAAEEYSVSLIMLPEGGKTPSELAKAAVILLDEPKRVRQPILFLPARV